jgi:hypothetical protein
LGLVVVWVGCDHFYVGGYVAICGVDVSACWLYNCSLLVLLGLCAVQKRLATL